MQDAGTNIGSYPLEVSYYLFLPRGGSTDLLLSYSIVVLLPGIEFLSLGFLNFNTKNARYRIYHGASNSGAQVQTGKESEARHFVGVVDDNGCDDGDGGGSKGTAVAGIQRPLNGYLNQWRFVYIFSLLLGVFTFYVAAVWLDA